MSTFRQVDLKDGSIKHNYDYGVGYTIVWQDKPIQLIKQKVATTPQQVIVLVMNQLDFLNSISEFKNDKYGEAKQLLLQTLKVLGNKRDEKNN